MARRSRRTLIDEARMFRRFAHGLGEFLAQPLSLDRCPDVIRKATESREEAFLNMLSRAVYQNPQSPYLELLKWNGVEFGDIEAMVRGGGVDGALACLFDAGVRISIDEFKGRTPIRRGGRELPVTAADFDNPNVSRHFEGSTGGSRGAGRRLAIDLGLVAHDAASHGLFLQAFALEKAALVLWRPVAPGAAGTKKALMHARLRLPIARWCSQNSPGYSANPKAALFTAYLVWASGRHKAPIPRPEFVPVQQAAKIADWLSARRDQGFHFDTNVSSAIRICQATRNQGRSLENVFFRLGGEPLTPSRSRLIGDLGARVTCHYSMSEIGHIGMACGNPSCCDDVHFRNDKMALLVRSAPQPSGPVSAFYFTALLPNTPKVMLNVASGDYGKVEQRNCGCPFDAVGLDLHLGQVRSYEKLTTAGMHFLGVDLIRLLDEVLPTAFGGGPTDYQMVEEETEEGTVRLLLLISPRVGPLDEQRCREAVFSFLRSRAPENRMMVDRLLQEDAVQVFRKDPYRTQTSKILPLHLLRKEP